MNQNDIDIFIFIAIFLFLINSYIYLFLSCKREGFFKRAGRAFKKVTKSVSKGLKKVGDVIADNTGISYVSDKIGLSKEINGKRCRAERERARRDQDNERKYLDNTTKVKNNIDSVKTKMDNSMTSDSEKVNNGIEMKNKEASNTAFAQQDVDILSDQILYQVGETYDDLKKQVAN